jgi:hypothetical protein
MPILKHCDCGVGCERTINVGSIIHANDCPLAVAIARGSEADGALVGHIETFLLRGNVAQRYFTSPELLALICRFEETGELLAGTYKPLPPVVN